MSGSSLRSFERRYRRTEDPWDFAQSPYEQGRYRAILESLGRTRYAHAFEPGCSIGVLTEKLAGFCDQLTATDFSATAVARARTRCAALPHVRIARGDVREIVAPAGAFDLIVFAEIGYYFEPDVLVNLIQRLETMLASAGELVACHWLGHSADHRLHGDEVHAILHGSLQLQPTRSQRYDLFRIDCWMRP